MAPHNFPRRQRQPKTISIINNKGNPTMVKTVAMALLLPGAIFLAGCATEQKPTDQAYPTQAYQILNQQLQNELETDQARIEREQNRLKITLPNDLLFPEDGYRLNRRGEQTLDKMVPALRRLRDGSVLVEGYTDNEPLGPRLKDRFPSNVELSATLATEVVRHLAAKGVPPRILVAEGLGDARPAAPNDTPEGRAKNRRVEIVITVQD